MLGMHRHSELLGGSVKERLRRAGAAREHAATLEMEDGGGDGVLLKPAGRNLAGLSGYCLGLLQGPV